MDILIFLLGILVGFLLGLLGGGGSILAVPIFVYIAGINPVVATGYSLFTVGITSLFGSIKNVKNKLINFETIIYFGSSSIITVFLIRKFIISNLPDIFFSISTFDFTKEIFIMGFFATIMFLSGISMIKNKKELEKLPKEINKLNLTLYGALVGIIAGFVGAGGGFLIVPALVLFFKLDIKKAIATSIAIIGLNTSIGFLGEILSGALIDWAFLLKFTSLSIVGIILGDYTSKYVKQSLLKKLFGYFVILMSIVILIEELFIV